MPVEAAAASYRARSGRSSSSGSGKDAVKCGAGAPAMPPSPLCLGPSPRLGKHDRQVKRHQIVSYSYLRMADIRGHGKGERPTTFQCQGYVPETDFDRYVARLTYIAIRMTPQMPKHYNCGRRLSQCGGQPSSSGPRTSASRFAILIHHSINIHQCRDEFQNVIQCAQRPRGAARCWSAARKRRVPARRATARW